MSWRLKPTPAAVPATLSGVPVAEVTTPERNQPAVIGDIGGQLFIREYKGAGGWFAQGIPGGLGVWTAAVGGFGTGTGRPTAAPVGSDV